MLSVLMQACSVRVYHRARRLVFMKLLNYEMEIKVFIMAKVKHSNGNSCVNINDILNVGVEKAVENVDKLGKLVIEVGKDRMTLFDSIGFVL